MFPDRDAVLNLPSDHPGLHLLQQIRDEAHRFAIQGHRARRGKARTTSTLQEIAGIGATRRKALLAHFGGVQGRAGGERRRPRARAGHQPRAGGADLRASCIERSRAPLRCGWTDSRPDPLSCRIGEAMIVGNG